MMVALPAALAVYRMHFLEASAIAERGLAFFRNLAVEKANKASGEPQFASTGWQAGSMRTCSLRRAHSLPCTRADNMPHPVHLNWSGRTRGPAAGHPDRDGLPPELPCRLGEGSHFATQLVCGCRESGERGGTPLLPPTVLTNTNSHHPRFPARHSDPAQRLACRAFTTPRSLYVPG
jgi:hypothetical protein